MRHINEAIIHCSATQGDWRDGQKTITKVKEIERWHLDRGWSGIGYHFIIDRDGTVAKGRDLKRAGAHVKGHNKNSIGICLLGGASSSANDQFEDHFTPEQEKALLQLLKHLNAKFGDIKISGHNQYANKACPGFYVPDWLAGRAPRPVRDHVGQTSTVKATRLADFAAVATPAAGFAMDLPVEKIIILGVFAAIGVGSMIYIRSERGKKFLRGDV